MDILPDSFPDGNLAAFLDELLARSPEVAFANLDTPLVVDHIMEAVTHTLEAIAHTVGVAVHIPLVVGHTVKVGIANRIKQEVSHTVAADHIPLEVATHIAWEEHLDSPLVAVDHTEVVVGHTEVVADHTEVVAGHNLEEVVGRIEVVDHIMAVEEGRILDPLVASLVELK